VGRIGDKSKLSATENFETVLSSLEMRCEQIFVSSRPCVSGVNAETICFSTGVNSIDGSRDRLKMKLGG